MIELIAKGIIDGKLVEVICETKCRKWCFSFNGEKNQELESELRNLMKSHFRVGNYPPKTMKLKLWGILESGVFFDRCFPREVKVIGQIEQIPYFGDDVVY